MATGLVTWSKTAATNSGSDSAVNFAEGQAPSTLNDSGRGLMASVAKWRDDTNGSLATTGGTTAYVLTTNQTFAALTAGYQVAFQINATNTGTSTLNVDSLGAKPLRKAANVEVVAGDLLIGRVYNATYFTSNSGEWLLHDASPTVIAADQVVTASILDANVTLAKMANLATKTAIGRNTGSTGVPEAVTIAQMLNWLGTAARGDIIRQGASNPERLALGTSGKVLTSDGTDAGWALPSRSLLLTLTPSGASESGSDTIFTSDYKFYEIEFTNIINATDAQELKFQIYSGSYRTSGYVANAHGIYSSGSGLNYVTTTHIPIGGAATDADNAAPGACGKLRLYNPSASAKCVVLGEFTYRYNNASLILGSGQVTGCWDTAGVVTGFRFIASSGNISGEIKVYGYN